MHTKEFLIDSHLWKGPIEMMSFTPDFFGGGWGEIGVHRYTRILEFCRITRLELRSLERDKFTWLYGIKNK